MAEQVDPVLHPARKGTIDDVDADMLVLPQRIGGGQHKGAAEQVPLRFEPGIRRHVECLADDGISGADQNGDQDEPGNGLADGFGDGVDQSAYAE